MDGKTFDIDLGALSSQGGSDNVALWNLPNNGEFQVRVTGAGTAPDLLVFNCGTRAEFVDWAFGHSGRPVFVKLVQDILLAALRRYWDQNLVELGDARHEALTLMALAFVARQVEDAPAYMSFFARLPNSLFEQPGSAAIIQTGDVVSALRTRKYCPSVEAMQAALFPDMDKAFLMRVQQVYATFAD